MIIRPNAVSFRYRVGRVTYVSTPEPDIGYEGSAHLEDVKEFKTYVGAEAYQKKLNDQGLSTVLQVAVIQWLSHDDASKLMQQLQAEGRAFE